LLAPLHRYRRGLHAHHGRALRPARYRLRRPAGLAAAVARVSPAMSSTQPPIIDIRGLSLAYERDGRRTEILSALDLAVPRGQFLVIVGESGVGKSTLLRVLIDLAKPSTGTVHLGTDPERTRTPM